MSRFGFFALLRQWFRLSDTVAQRRILYRRPIATLPDITILDIPVPFANPTLPANIASRDQGSGQSRVIASR
jgi:hypothetical protein